MISTRRCATVAGRRDDPRAAVDRAQKFRRWYRAQVLELFKSVDVIIAPATPCVAPKLGR